MTCEPPKPSIAKFREDFSNHLIQPPPFICEDTVPLEASKFHQVAEMGIELGSFDSKSQVLSSLNSSQSFGSFIA